MVGHTAMLTDFEVHPLPEKSIVVLLFLHRVRAVRAVRGMQTLSRRVVLWVFPLLRGDCKILTFLEPSFPCLLRRWLTSSKLELCARSGPWFPKSRSVANPATDRHIIKTL